MFFFLLHSLNFGSCRATLVAELVKRAEVILQDAMKAEDGNHDKLLDAVCSQLYQEGAQALIQGKE